MARRQAAADPWPTARTLALRAVLICGDELLRRRIESALEEQEITLAQIVDNVESGAEAALAHGVDVMIFAAGRSNTARNAALGRLRHTVCGRSIVVVGPQDTRRGVRSAIEAGADGLVFERDVEKRLAATIRAVHSGQVAVPRANRHDLGRPSLSVREKEVLRLIVMGMTNREIATALYLAESTVKSHLSSAFGKLGVRSRNEAVDLILSDGDRLGLGILTLRPRGSR